MCKVGSPPTRPQFSALSHTHTQKKRRRSTNLDHSFGILISTQISLPSKEWRCPSHLAGDQNQWRAFASARIGLSALRFCTVLHKAGDDSTPARHDRAWRGHGLKKLTAHVAVGVARPTANPESPAPSPVRRRRGVARRVGAAAATGSGLTAAWQVDVSNYVVSLSWAGGVWSLDWWWWWWHGILPCRLRGESDWLPTVLP